MSVERPFLPTPSQRTVWPSPASCRSSANARRSTCALNAPASPRSPVSGTIRTVSIVSRCSRSGSRTDAGRPPDARDQLAHGVGVGPHRLDARLRAPQLRGRDELDRARDLARVADGPDPPLEVLDGSHGLSRRSRQPVSSSTLKPSTNFSSAGVELRVRLVGEVAALADRLRRPSPARGASRAAPPGSEAPGRRGRGRASRGCRRRSRRPAPRTGHGWYCGWFSVATIRSPRASACCVAGVELGAELRERLELAVLREVEAQAAGDLLHRLRLRVAADAGHRDADVDRRLHAREEEARLEEDLAVGDRDDVRRDVGGDVAGLRLDDGSAVSEPPPSSSESLQARSSRREWR